jgi:transcriptional regulator with XRE-family HTH domain
VTAADLRALRKRLGLTQAQLAAALDLSPSTISNYEGGGRPALPIPRVVELACQALVAKDQRDWSVID